MLASNSSGERLKGVLSCLQRVAEIMHPSHLNPARNLFLPQVFGYNGASRWASDNNLATFLFSLVHQFQTLNQARICQHYKDKFSTAVEDKQGPWENVGHFLTEIYSTIF